MVLLMTEEKRTKELSDCMSKCGMLEIKDLKRL